MPSSCSTAETRPCGAISYHEIRVPNTQLSTHQFGMLGAGVGQALGAAVARPDKQVYCIIGDGAIGFHPQEVETAVRNDLKVIFLVLLRQTVGHGEDQPAVRPQARQDHDEEVLGPDETINTDLGEIEFDKLAQAMGAHGERVADPAGLRPAIERALASGPGGDPCRRGSGQAHVGAGSSAFQGHAPGTSGEGMDELDPIRLNFSPQSLVALDVIGLDAVGWHST